MQGECPEFRGTSTFSAGLDGVDAVLDLEAKRAASRSVDWLHRHDVVARVHGQD